MAPTSGGSTHLTDKLQYDVQIQRNLTLIPEDEHTFRHFLCFLSQLIMAKRRWCVCVCIFFLILDGQIQWSHLL